MFTTSQRIIVDADANNYNVWLIDKASGNVFGALGLCGIIPCPGHNVGVNLKPVTHSPSI